MIKPPVSAHKLKDDNLNTRPWSKSQNQQTDSHTQSKYIADQTQNLAEPPQCPKDDYKSTKPQSKTLHNPTTARRTKKKLGNVHLKMKFTKSQNFFTKRTIARVLDLRLQYLNPETLDTKSINKQDEPKLQTFTKTRPMQK